MQDGRESDGMWISRYVCLFLIYGYLGWVYESVFCTIQEGKWENRGFLYGPITPIYGTGAIALSLILRFCAERGAALSPVLIYTISVFGSAILEYVTSWALEKIFHALWWDYSNLPLNVHGRISLFTSLGFGVAGLVIAYAIAPFFEGLMDKTPPIIIELMSLCLLFIFAVDITVTVTALYHFDQLVIRADALFNRSMTSLVGGVAQRTSRVKQGIITRQTAITDEISSMSECAKKAVHRVYAFKDENKRLEAFKNKLLSVIKKLGEKARKRPDDE